MSDADGKTENCTKCVNSMRNLFLAVAVAIPSIVIGLWICSKPDCNEVKDNEYLEYLCTAGLEQPLLFVNVMLLANMCGLLWLVSVFTGSCWLIDFYWTIIPVMVAAFYKFHPDAVNASDSWDILNISTWRSNGTFVLLLAWHCRLTYSYMRREKWQLGAREDWRFSDMRTKYGAAWNFISIFYAYLSQMPLMFGLTLPYYIINLHSHHLDGSFNEYDVWIIAYAAIGLLIAHQADTELFNYMEINLGRSYANIKPLNVLNTGLWRYSRHPNYFGECLFWGALSIGYGVLCPTTSDADDHSWIVYGWLLNTLVMFVSMGMVETRMLTPNGKESDYANTSPSTVPKHVAYRYYTDYTSFFFPWGTTQDTYLCGVAADLKLKNR